MGKWEMMGSRGYEQPQEGSPWDDLAEDDHKARHDIDVQWTLDHEADEGVPHAHYPEEKTVQDKIEMAKREALKTDEEREIDKSIEAAIAAIQAMSPEELRAREEEAERQSKQIEEELEAMEREALEELRALRDEM